MITTHTFSQEWRRHCLRHGRAIDQDEAACYLEYLSEQMDEATFVAASRALWATSRFFPRPADFVLIGAGGEWRLVIRCIEGFAPPKWEWTGPWKELSDRGREACKQLGGMETMRAAFERDALRLKAAWEQAYEQATAAEVLQLVAGEVRQLQAVR